MPRFAAVFFLLGVASFCGGQEAAAPPAADGLKTPSDYFKLARQQTDIRQEGAAPFRMKATFTVTSAIGNQQSGEYSELWVSAERWRRDIIVGDYHESSACVSGAYYNAATSDTVDATAAEVLGNFTPYIEPVKDEARINREWKATTEKMGDIPLEQVSPAVPSKPVLGSVVITYWFAPDSGYIRVMIVSGRKIVYNNFHLALGRALPYGVTIGNGVTSMSAPGKHSDIQINSIEPAGTPNDDAFVIPGEAKGKCIATEMPPSFMNGTLVKAGGPEYPPAARAAHLSGVVDLLFTIGHDGHVKHVKTLGHPPPLLADAAMKSVRQNVYAPYLLDGVPTDINREGAYVFQISPH